MAVWEESQLIMYVQLTKNHTPDIVVIIQVPDTILVKLIICVRVFDDLQKVIHRATVSRGMSCVINHHKTSLNYIPYY